MPNKIFNIILLDTSTFTVHTVYSVCHLRFFCYWIDRVRIGLVDLWSSWIRGQLGLHNREREANREKEKESCIERIQFAWLSTIQLTGLLYNTKTTVKTHQSLTNSNWLAQSLTNYTYGHLGTYAHCCITTYTALHHSLHSTASRPALHPSTNTLLLYNIQTSTVKTYVFLMLRTYVMILCNWLILWQNALYLYLGRLRMYLNTSRNHVSKSSVEAFKSIQEIKQKVQFH